MGFDVKNWFLKVVKMWVWFLKKMDCKVDFFGVWCGKSICKSSQMDCKVHFYKVWYEKLIFESRQDVSLIFEENGL